MNFCRERVIGRKLARDLNWMVKVFERMSGKRDFDLIVEQLMRQSSSIALQLWDRDENQRMS